MDCADSGVRDPEVMEGQKKWQKEELCKPFLGSPQSHFPLTQEHTKHLPPLPKKPRSIESIQPGPVNSSGLIAIIAAGASLEFSYGWRGLSCSSCGSLFTGATLSYIYILIYQYPFLSFLQVIWFFVIFGSWSTSVLALISETCSSKLHLSWRSAESSAFLA